MKRNTDYPKILKVAPDLSRRESCFTAATNEKGDSPPACDMPRFQSGHSSLEETRRGSLAVVMPKASPSYSPNCKTGRR